MAVRGAEEKLSIQNKILETFDGAFVYNGGKEIRVPINGIQVKVVLTAAKDNVEPGDDVAIPGAPKVAAVEGSAPVFQEATPKVVEPSQEELDNVSNLLSSLGL